MRSFTSSALLAGFLLVAQGLAGPLVQRDGTTTTGTGTGTGTTTASSTTTAATAGLVETVVNGKTTTLQVAAPTGDATETSSKSSAAATITSTGTESVTSTSSAAATSTSGVGDVALLQCKAPTGSPICLPSNATVVDAGSTYYVTWDPTRFDVNATINILLNYANDSSGRVAYTSEGIPKQKGFLTLTMDKNWLQSTINMTLQFALVSYTPVSDHTAKALQGPTVFLQNAPVTHFAPPLPTKMPTHLSLYIGVPLGVGALAFVLLGLFFGMRSHRHIDVKSIMSKRKGYGNGKSKRQRLGLKKGAIRLEERELAAAGFSDDEIRTVAPPRIQVVDTNGHGYAHRRDESLGSLVSDSEGGNNAFRREIEKQKTGR